MSKTERAAGEADMAHGRVTCIQLVGRELTIGHKQYLLPKSCGGRGWIRYTVSQLQKIIEENDGHLLVVGETGTGKESLAEWVGCHAKNTNKKEYRAVNCSALTPERLQSDLFGHTRGSYTGAHEERLGLLRTCDGGALFIDEIGHEHAKCCHGPLLRYMQSGDIQALGTDNPTHANTRIIAATNNPDNLPRDFRARFTFEIHLPTLCERKEDIPWFLCRPKYGDMRNPFAGITLHALLGMYNCKWDENIRGLINHLHDDAFLAQEKPSPDDLLSHRIDKILTSRLGLGTIDWCVFSGFVLSALENNSSLLAPYLNDEEALRVIELLAYAARLPSVAPATPVILLSTLRQMLTSNDEDSCVFNTQPLAEILNKIMKRNTIASNQFRGDRSGFIHALVSLDDMLALFKESELGVRLEDSAANVIAMEGGLCSATIIDSMIAGYLEGLVVPASAVTLPRQETRDGGNADPRHVDLCRSLEQKADKEFISLLNQHVSDISDRAICLLCNAEGSVRKIAEQHGGDYRRVQERLASLRELAAGALKNYLPMQGPGRPKAKLSG